MKRYVVGILILVMLVGQSIVLANEKRLQTEPIKSEPVNVIHYLDEGVDYVAEILARLAKTGKPVLMFNRKHGNGRIGAEVTLFENIPKQNFNVVGGAVFGNEEPARWFIGVEYELTLVGGMWEMFRRFRPAFYLCEGEFYWGFSFEFRPE